MKNFAIILLSLLSVVMSSKAQETSFFYKISLDEVTNPVSAKEATDIVRNVFHVFPAYNDSTNRYEFKCGLDITKIDFEMLMNNAFYHVSLFEKKEVIVLKEK